MMYQEYAYRAKEAVESDLRHIFSRMDRELTEVIDGWTPPDRIECAKCGGWFHSPMIDSWEGENICLDCLKGVPK